ERKRRIVDGVVLDVERLDAELRREAVRLHQRREADLRADGRLAVNRQQLAVAPHALRAGLDDFAGERGFDRAVVVRSLERAEIEIADMDGLLRVELAALAALEVREEGRSRFLHGDGTLPGVARAASAAASLSSVPKPCGPELDLA